MTEQTTEEVVESVEDVAVEAAPVQEIDPVAALT